MRKLWVYRDPFTESLNLYRVDPEYPLEEAFEPGTRSLDSIPDEIKSKLSMLKLIPVGDTIIGLGSRPTDNVFVIEVADDLSVEDL